MKRLFTVVLVSLAGMVGLKAQCADFSFAAPFSHSGTTVGAGDDCAFRPTEDVTYEVTVAAAGTYTFSLCGASWDTYMYLSTACCGGSEIHDDDFCSFIGPSEITTALAPGTYYVTIEAFSTSSTPPSGPYTLNVTFAPPPPSGTCDPAYSSAPGIAIPDNDPAGITDDIVISGASGTITDLNAIFNIDHTWVGDLIVTLEHVNTGTTVTLIDRPGVPNTTFGCSSNDFDVRMDDEAGTAIEGTCGPSSSDPFPIGDFIPNNPLSVFDGESINGTWRVTVSDNAGGDDGTLVSWCLDPTLACAISSAPNAAIPDSNMAGITDTISISQFNTDVVTDMNVGVQINHTWVGDLVVSLTHVQSGTTVTLIETPGAPPTASSCPGDDVDAVLDDGAPTPVETECDTPNVPAINGTFIPNQALSAFNGETMAGDWVLHVADVGFADVGSLVSWCLDPSTVPGIPYNDECSNAIPLECGDVVTGTTINATPDPAPFCSTAVDAPGVWYTVVGNGDMITASLCNPGTNYDTRINVYDGSCGFLNCIGGDDDACGFAGPSEFSWMSEPCVTYYILVQGFNNMTGDFELSVDCASPPTDLVADAGPDQAYCYDNGANFVALGGSPTGSGGYYLFPYHYSWSPTTGLNDATAANPIAGGPVLTPGTYVYTVTVTDTCGNVATDEVTLTVWQNPVADAGADFGICESTPSTVIGGSPTATLGTPPYSYSWSPAAGLSSTTASNPTFTHSGVGLYTFVVTVTDAHGCQDMDTVTVEVWDDPIADAGSDTTVCQFEPVMLGGSPTATAGNTPYTYAWTPTVGLDDPTLANPTATPSITTTYTVVVTDVNGCTDEDTIRVKVYPLTPVSFTGLLPTYCENEAPSVLTGSPAGGVFSGPGITGNTFDPNLAGPGTHDIIYTYVDINGCTNADTQSTTVYDAPDVFAGNDTTICSNQTLTLGGNPTAMNGTPPLTYSWLPVDYLSDPSVPNPVFTPTAIPNYSYTLTVTDANGCSRSDVINITVLPAPIADAGPDVETCVDCNPVRIGGDPTAVSGNGNLDYSYSWMPTTGLNDPTVANPLANPATTTTYTVTVTDNVNGCTDMDVVTVTVNPLPVVSFTGLAANYCVDNGPVALVGSPAGGTFYGDGVSGDPSSEAFTLCYDGTYRAIPDNTLPLNFVMNGSGIQGDELGTNVTLDSVRVIIEHTWIGDLTMTLESPGGSIVTLFDQPGVPATPFGCPGDNMAVNFVTGTGNDIENECNGYDPAIHGSFTAHNGDDLNNLNDGSDPNGVWGVVITDIQPGFTGRLVNVTLYFTSMGSASTNATFDPSTGVDTFTVYYAYTDPNGCMNIDSQTTIVHDLPTALAGADQTICSNEDATLGSSPAAVGGEGPYTYSWMPTTNLDDPTSANPTFTPPAAGSYTYTLTVTDVWGCMGQDEVTITVNPTPVADAGADDDVCVNSSIVLGGSPTASGGTPGYTYSWAPGAGLSSTTVANPTFSPVGVGTYNFTVTVTDANGCQDMDTVDIIVNPLPVVDAGNNERICANESVVLGGSPTASGTGPFTYSWSPTAGLSSATASNPTFSPSAAGVYNFTVTVTDGNGCVNTDVVTITVDPVPVADAGPDQTICADETAVLGGSPTASGGAAPYFYTWAPATGLNFTSIANPTFDPPSAGTYTFTVTVRDNIGCENTDEVTITVNPLPVVTILGLQTEYCEDDDPTIVTGTPAGGTFNSVPGLLNVPFGGSQYQTSFMGVPVGIPDNDPAGVQIAQSVSVPGTSLGTNITFDSIHFEITHTWVGDLTIELFNPAGNSVMLLDQPGGAGSCGGDNINATVVPGTGNSMENVCNNNPAIAGTFTAHDGFDLNSLNDGTNPNGSWELLIRDLGPFDVGTLTSATLYFSGPGLVFDPSVAGPGNYTVIYTYTDGNGCTNADTINVTVHPLPVVDIVGLDTAFCFDAPDVTLVGSPTGGTFSGNGVVLLALNPSQADVPGYLQYTSNYYYIPNPVTGYYRRAMMEVVYTAAELNAQGIVGPSYIYQSGWNIITAPDYDLPGYTIKMKNTTLPDASYYQGATGWTQVIGPFTYAPTPGGYDMLTFDQPFYWNGVDNVAMEICWSQSAAYSLNGCASFTYQYGGINYQWDDNPGTLCGDVPFYWTYYRPNVLFSAASGFDQQFSPTTAGPGMHTIYYTYTDSNGCTNVDSQTVTVYPEIFVNAGLDSTICNNEAMALGGDSAMPTASGGVPPYMYSWSPAANLDDPTAANPFFTPTGAGSYEYIVTVTDDVGCMEMDTIDIMVDTVPDVSFTGLDSEYCFNAACDTLIGTPSGGIFTGPGVIQGTGGGGISCNTFSIDLPPQSSIFSSTLTRGHWFVAPVDFTITSLMVPTSVGGTQQAVEVVLFPQPPPVPAFPTITPITSLYWNTGPAGVPFSVSIPVTAGDIIGIVGAGHNNTATMLNSYGPAGTYNTTIGGQPVTLTRCGTQTSINAGPSTLGYWSEPGGSLGRVEWDYEICTSGGGGSGGGCTAATPLSTPFNNNNGQSGNMFDVVATSNIEVTDFDVNIAGTSTIEIYTKTGTYQGFQGNAGAWTLVTTVPNVPSLGIGVPSPVNANINVPVSAGATQAFYVTTTSGTMEYTNGGAVGNVLASNGDLQILEGAGIAYPFAGTFEPRDWNGILHYNVCPPSAGPAVPAAPCDYTITLAPTFLMDEVSWTFTDNNGVVVGSGGPYPTNPVGQTITAIVNSSNPPNTFFIENQGTFNDNNLTYTITSNGMTLATAFLPGGSTATETGLDGMCGGSGGGSGGVVCNAAPPNSYPNVPTPVPPTGTSGTNTEVFNISGYSGVLGTDVNMTSVDIQIDHTFTGDLDIFLTAPNGVQVQLFDQFCGGSNNLDFTIIPGTTNPINFAPCGAQPAITGTWNAIIGQDLGNINTGGGSANGNWILTIVDNFAGDSGFLNDWTLNFETCSSSSASAVDMFCPDSAGPGLHTIYYTYTDGNGCTAIDSQQVLVRELPTVMAGPDTTICAGDGATLTVQASGTSGPYTYMWFPSAGLSDTTGSTVIASPDTSTQYTVYAIDSFGCSNFDTVDVTIRPLPEVTIEPNPNDSICYGDSLCLTANVSGSGACTPGTVMTITQSGNGGNVGGMVYFDLDNTSGGNLNITELGMNISASTIVNIYTIPGGSAGNQTNMGAWTLAGTADGTTGPWSRPFPGNGTLTPCPVNGGSITLGPGLWGIGLETPTASHNYTNGTGGNQTYTTPELTLQFGTATNFPFAAPIFDPRVWNGYINYCAGGGGGSGGGSSTSQLPEVVKATPAGVCPTPASAGPVCDCPTGYVVVGYSGDMGNGYGPQVLSKFRLHCRELLPNGTLGSATTVTCDNGSAAGNTAVGPEIAASGEALVGAELRVGCAVDQVQGRSKPIADIIANGSNATNNTMNPIGGTGGTAQGVQLVPDGSVIVGMQTYTDPGNDIAAGVAWRYAEATQVQSGGGGVTYLWSTGDTTQTICPNPLVPTTYWVQVTDDLGCVGSDTIDIFVNPEIIVDAGPDIDLCQGDSAVLGGAPTVSGGTPPYTITWEPTDRLDDPTIANPTTNTLLSITYTVTVVDSNGCSVSDAVRVYSRDLPKANAGDDLTICDGESIVIGGVPAATGGTGPYTYSWGPATDLNSTTVANPTASPTTTTFYTLTVTDIYGCVDDSIMQLVVYPLPDPTITAAGPFCANDPSVFLSAATGGGVWAGPGIVDPNTGEFDPSVAGAGTHSIMYTATSFFGCDNIDTIDIVVNPVPNVQITSATNYCLNGSVVTLTANVAGGTWSGSGIINASTGEFDPGVAGLGTRPIMYAYTDGNGCTGYDTAMVTVSMGPDPTIDPVSPMCNNDAAINLTAATPGGTWSGTGITNASAGTFDPSVAGAGSHVITYTVSAANGCQAMDTITIVVNGVVGLTINPAGPFCQEGPTTLMSASIGGGYWSGAGIINPLIGEFSPAAAGPGLHTITYTVTGNDGCISRATEDVMVNATPDATITAVAPMCANDPSINLTAATAGGTWSGPGITNAVAGTFDPSVAGAGNHIIHYEVTDVNGCSAEATRVVKVNALPVISGSATDVLCPGDENGAIDVSVEGGAPPYTYSWSNGANHLDLDEIAAGSYTLTVTDSKGCSQEATFTVGTLSTPMNINAVVTNALTPEYNNGAIDLTVTGSGPFQYHWSNGETTEDISGLNPDTVYSSCNRQVWV